MSPRLFDAHNHWHDERLAHLDGDTLRAGLREDGVVEGMVNGTHPEDWEAVAQLCAHWQPMARPAYGIHPWRVGQEPPDWDLKLAERLRREPRASIGECGLDRWIDSYDLPRQQRVLTRHLALAHQYGRAITLHCLRAWEALQQVLDAACPLPRGFLLHSYGGAPELIPWFAKRGAYFSASGYFADTRKKNFARILPAIPADRLLVETDAPDMLPPEDRRPHEAHHPQTGRAINHPRNLQAVYRFVAEARGTTVAKLAETCETNYRSLFGD